MSAIVNLSPYCLPNGAFVGFMQGSIHDFGKVTGVFGLFFLPGNPPAKYKVIYPRSMAEVPVVKVH